MHDDDDWVGTPPEGRYSRDRARPEFWRNQWQASIGGAIAMLLIVALVLPSHALAGSVQILESGAVLGGSEYRVRARNRNTRPVRLQLTATTVEPLPHS